MMRQFLLRSQNRFPVSRSRIIHLKIGHQPRSAFIKEKCPSTSAVATAVKTDCPMTRKYAESGSCGKLFRDWYACNDDKAAPKLFQDWLQCLEDHDNEEQLDSFFRFPASAGDQKGDANVDATKDYSEADPVTHLPFDVDNRVRAAWETLIQVDLANLCAVPFPDSLRPRIEWTPSGKVTILFRNDLSHNVEAMFVQSSSQNKSNTSNANNNFPQRTHLLAAAAPHNLVAQRILSFQLSPTTSPTNLHVSAVYETTLVASKELNKEPSPLEVL
ncbi:hypothetical protein MPSEU_000530800 [Mayamaea pseudoterrestris]|nr:hypothetical protein MPSEU_000530800 [Mayamaea pseudoterrestris]